MIYFYNTSFFDPKNSLWQESNYVDNIENIGNIFCKECKKLSINKECTTEENMRIIREYTDNSWYEKPPETKKFIYKPSEINKNNNCPYFKNV